MSYIDAIKDSKSEVIKVVERLPSGKRIFQEYPIKYEFYIEDPKGKYRSIFNTPLTKIKCRNNSEFQREIRINSNKTIFESDLNPIFTCLSDHYLGTEPPVPNIGFFDIETDFSLANGYARPDDPFCAVTAISIYMDWLNALISLVLIPKTLNMEQATALVEDIPNVILFDNEAALLSSFLDIIEDVDIFSGWNCIPLTQSVWGKDKIYTVNNVLYQDMLYDSVVEHVFPEKIKEKYDITLENGHVVSSSGEHRFPIWWSPLNKYGYSIDTLIVDDLPVRDVQSLCIDNSVYLKQPMRKNTAEDLTYRQLIINNLQCFIDLGVEFIIRDTAIVKKLTRVIGTATYNNLARAFWTISNIESYLSHKEIIEFFMRNDTVMSYHLGVGIQNAIEIKLDEPITPQDLWLAGMWFTDGTSTYKHEVSICNKDENIILEVRNAFKKYRKKHPDLMSPLARHKDGCFYERGGLSKLWFLKLFIYDGVQTKSNKKLNVQFLSQLSYSQFLSFFGGAVDGDGSVNSIITLCNYNNAIDDFCNLLHWNGIFTTISTNRTLLSCYIDGFDDFLFHPVKKQRAAQLSSSFEHPSSGKNKKWICDVNGNYYVKIRDIVATGINVPMKDINTSTSYFVTNGIETHNSSLFDLPYMVNRITKTLSKDDTRRFCLWNQLPKRREFQRYGKTQFTYDLVGRVHLDYLDIYRKYNYEERHSYTLDAIAEYELNEHKVQYEGTLDQLYNVDFRTFVEYNRQDAELLYKLEHKLKFMDLANVFAHENGVLLPSVLGTVQATDQAIINEAHALGFQVPNKKIQFDSTQSESSEFEEYDDDEDDSENSRNKSGAVGAYVAHPVVGFHKWIGLLDVKSLYPSTIRALNMGIETIVGQLRPTLTDAYIQERMKPLPGKKKKRSFASAWEGLFGTLEYFAVINREIGTDIIIDWEDGKSSVLSGAEAYQLIFQSNKKWILSANGTIFRFDREGIIPGLLKRWYTDRVHMQEQLQKAIDTNDTEKIPYWNKRQLVRKINLNSLNLGRV